MGHETCLRLPSWSTQATPELGTLLFVGLIGIYSTEKPKESYFSKARSLKVTPRQEPREIEIRWKSFPSGVTRPLPNAFFQNCFSNTINVCGQPAPLRGLLTAEHGGVWSLSERYHPDSETFRLLQSSCKLEVEGMDVLKNVNSSFAGGI